MLCPSQKSTVQGLGLDRAGVDQMQSFKYENLSGKRMGMKLRMRLGWQGATHKDVGSILSASLARCGGAHLGVGRQRQEHQDFKVILGYVSRVEVSLSITRCYTKRKE